ncbi:MAG TPA: hypothetical protein ENK37_09740 [Oceanithermus profundus]|uniref:Uncharacterized protein n=1 Tax=Oceanithermus profundus TaxID=187137 RepID=A0A7C4VHH5_9DEIN|nr:hypothetical protein [Oceanithermus profundus]
MPPWASVGGVRNIGAALLLALVLAACGTSEGGVGEPLRITVSSAPPAYLGERYEARFPASGGVRPYRYELEGKLPQGLNFTNGRLSGLPREKGSFKITVVVTDAALSSRSATFTLHVKDPPPPKLTVKLPQSETDAPFIAVLTLSERPTQALRLRLTLKDLKPDLESLKVAPELIYVLRYDAEKQTLDLDGAFTKTFKGGELLRLRLEPLRKLRPKVSSQAQFFDAKGEPYTKTPPKRPADSGRYGFEELRTLAARWLKSAPSAAPAPKASGPPAQKPADSADGQEGTDSQDEAVAPSEEAEGPPAKASPEESERQPPEDSAVASPQPNDQPAAENLEPAPPAFDPDLDGDGKVGAADLELLRADYAFNPGGRLSPPKPSENPDADKENPSPGEGAQDREEAPASSPKPEDAP